MDDRSEMLRFELEAARDGQARWRCPIPLRERVVAYAREQMEVHDRSQLSVARELGLSESGLGRWMRRSGEPSGRFRPVEVVDSVSGPFPSSSLVLVTPQGYRVEGLSLAAVAALLPRL